MDKFPSPAIATVPSNPPSILFMNPIPKGFHTVTPYLVIEGAADVITFTEKAFGGKVTEKITRPDGKIGHAQVLIGDSQIMVAEACGEMMKSMPASIYLYVPDTDATYKAALEAGATSVMEPKDQFYGDRSGGVKDALGNFWWIGTHIEDVPSDELQRRATEAMNKRSAS